VHVGKIRKTIDPDGMNHRIRTVRDTGFIPYTSARCVSLHRFGI
jgi:DNA-binding response OmpR family regulator